MAIVFKAVLVEGFSNRSHPAVHHIGRRHDIGAGPRMRQRFFGEQLQRAVIIDVAVFDHAAVAVVGVFAQDKRRS